MSGKKLNIIFLTLVEVDAISDRGIYHDLIREFRDNGHDVTIVTPTPRRNRRSTFVEHKDGVTLLHVRTLNIQKSSILEKGLGTLAIEYQYLSALKKYLQNDRYDLILYSTPPITFVKVIRYLKRRYNSYAYLLLKDIFPQNAVDMQLLRKDSLLHRFFLRKEKKLYANSDRIGCMSPANVKYVRNHNSWVSSDKLEVNPNSIKPLNLDYTSEQIISTRLYYELPSDSRVFVYGGNLGRPQGIDFLLETIRRSRNKAFFLIIGDGTEYKKIAKWFEIHRPTNAKLLKSLPKDDYDKLLVACDIGLILLDRKFTIPNFPSRLLSYLEMKLPIIAATDPVTDIGDIIETNNCGFKVLAGDHKKMQEVIAKLLSEDLKPYKDNCKNLLEKQFLVTYSYNIILNSLNNNSKGSTL